MIREDQKEIIEFIDNTHKKYKGAYLAAKAGWGKTLPVIEIIKSFLKKKDKPVLIVVPAYLVYNWLDEFEKWGLETDICVVDSYKQKLHPARIYIGSYNMISYELISKQLLKKEFSLLVADEAHTFRTWNSQRARRILGTYQNKKSNMLARSEQCILMSGTPIVNSVEDIYNQIVRIAPKIFSKITKMDFLIKYAAKLDRTPWGCGYKAYGIKYEEQLKKKLRSVMVAPQVIKDLPPLVVNHIPLQLKGARLKAYIKEEEAFLRDHGISECDIIDLQSMRKIDVSMFAAIRQQVALHKIPLVLPAITDAFDVGKRPIVYCWHKGVQQALFEKIKTKRKNACIAIVNGQISTKKRFEIVKKYQQGEIDILLSTIGALKEGVNLTEGSFLILVEYPYTPAELEQVIARLHRTGQEQTVYVQAFYFKSGIDNHIYNLVKQKQDVIDKVMKD